MVNSITEKWDAEKSANDYAVNDMLEKTMAVSPAEEETDEQGNMLESTKQLMFFKEGETEEKASGTCGRR
ncbi:MAG: hypothetical protein K2N44_04420 [Lachnospiraceae bacterium]|nr:hypothetical protein [Lachnospiraceae bacterium]